MKLVTNKFKLGGLHEKHVVASQHVLIDTGKPRKTCVEVAGRRTFRILTSNQQSGIKASSGKTHPVISEASFKI